MTIKKKKHHWRSEQHPKVFIFFFKLQVQKRDFPHLLVHGPPGAGKKTRILCILKELYGNAAERLKVENMQFEVRHAVISLLVIELKT